MDILISPVFGVASCLTIACTYVGALHIFSSKKDRNHPDEIKRRIQICIGVSLASGMYLYYIIKNYRKVQDYSIQNMSDASLFLEVVGLRSENFVIGTLYPLVSISILFLGPLVQKIYNEELIDEFKYTPKEVIFRNIVCAPLSEEFCFRACMIPLLVPGCGATCGVLLAPWLFGVAHLHHYFEGAPLPQVLAQLGYTSVFGLFESFAFYRTQHFAGILLCHAFCNYMGFPDFHDAWNHPHKTKIKISYYVGIVGFMASLYCFPDLRARH